MKKAVVTVAVGKGLEWLAISRPSIEGYARRVGAEFVVLSAETCPVYGPGEKWQVYDTFDTFERVLFIDADIIVRPTAPDLFGLVPADHVALYDDLPDMDGYGWYYQETEQVQRELGFQVRPLPYCLNTGVVMASKEHRELWQRPNFLRPFHCWEQHAANCRIRDAGWPVYLLPRTFNSQWWSDKSKDQFTQAHFIHFSGMKDHAERIRLMQATAAEVEKGVVAEVEGRVVTPLPPKKPCNCGNKKPMAMKPI